MERGAVGVVRGRRFRSVDGFEVYGDGGTGTVDEDHAVTPRRVLLWPDVAVMAGHLFGGHVMAVHLDSVGSDGQFEGTHLLDEHLYPAAAVVFETGPRVFGRFRHAVVTEDAVGNATAAGVTVHETVVNSDPPAASDLMPVAHDSGTDQLTLTFVPSDRLTG